MNHRSEDELRAAFAAKAAEAPPADELLRAVRREVTTRSDRRRWLVPAVAAAAAVAVGVPLGIGLSGNGSNRAGSSRMQQDQTTARGAGQAPSPPLSAASASGALCRPGDVTVTVRRDTAGATLTVTSHGVACRLDRVPGMQWPGNGQPYGSEPQSKAAGRPGPAAAPAAPAGVLPAGATATATVRWGARCGGPSGDVVRVDWGAGPVDVRAGPASRPGCAHSDGQPLRVGAFTGLS